jgi:hypothetical protein
MVGGRGGKMDAISLSKTSEISRGGRTIYVTDGILEELCHQYKDPV